MKSRFEYQGQAYEIEAQNIRGTIWVHFQGKNFTYESAAQLRKTQKRTAGGARGELHSPMPGKVTKVLKAVGDQVKVGDAVLVMEAMKMEYTLKSEMTGILSEISCRVGEQVPLNKKLAQIIEGKK
jgi:biotin carboxyl carrier protein